MSNLNTRVSPVTLSLVAVAAVAVLLAAVAPSVMLLIGAHAALLGLGVLAIVALSPRRARTVAGPAAVAVRLPAAARIVALAA